MTVRVVLDADELSALLTDYVPFTETVPDAPLLGVTPSAGLEIVTHAVFHAKTGADDPTGA